MYPLMDPRFAEPVWPEPRRPRHTHRGARRIVLETRRRIESELAGGLDP